MTLLVNLSPKIYCRWHCCLTLLMYQEDSRGCIADIFHFCAITFSRNDQKNFLAMQYYSATLLGKINFAKVILMMDPQKYFLKESVYIQPFVIQIFGLYYKMFSH